jgi:glycerol uptake facilitator-like aquaporin
VSAPSPHRVARRAAAEGAGTAGLLVAVVGSGIMAERLAGGNVALALLANSLATGGALFALIATLQPISGAHLNPMVTLADAWLAGGRWREAGPVVAAQVAGAIAGVVVAHAMFSAGPVSWAAHDRGGPALAFSEAVATFGLLAVVLGCGTRRPDMVPAAVSAYIVAAYWCTSSTSFANPAVTIARSLTETFAGIRVVDVPGFLAAQAIGAAAAVGFMRWLDPDRPR